MAPGAVLLATLILHLKQSHNQKCGTKKQMFSSSEPTFKGGKIWKKVKRTKPLLFSQPLHQVSTLLLGFTDLSLSCQ